MSNSKWVSEKCVMSDDAHSKCFLELSKLNDNVVSHRSCGLTHFTGLNFQVEVGQIIAKHSQSNTTVKVAEYEHNNLIHMDAITFTPDGEVLTTINMDELIPERYSPIVIELGVQHPRITKTNWFDVQTHIQSELYNGKQLTQIMSELNHEATTCEDDDFEPEFMKIKDHIEIVNQSYPNTYCLSVEVPQSSIKTS